jgi:hypothetical protein
MSSYLTCIPAYGRDYASAEEVKKAWEDEKDFQIEDVSSRFNGSLINKVDAKNFDVPGVKIRYKKLKRVVEIVVGESVEA